MTTDTPTETSGAANLEGLAFIGTLLRVEPARYRETQEVIDGLANAIFLDPQGRINPETGKPERRINLSREVRQLMGPVTLPAFAKLSSAMPDTRWIVTLKVDQSEPDAKGRTYTNYTAIDAERV